MLVLLSACACKTEGGGGGAQRAVMVSDVHFDPFYDAALFNRLLAAEASRWRAVFESSSVTALPSTGRFTNYPLLKDSLDAARTAAPDPAFVVFPGDILAHGFHAKFFALYGSNSTVALNSFIKKTIEFFVLEIEDRFPRAPVFFTLGNNDAYEGDYDLVAGGTFLADTADVFYTPFLAGYAKRAAFDADWRAWGGFAAHFPDKTLTVLSLDSVLFSRRRPAPAKNDAAFAHLEWFARELAAAHAAGRNVIVVTHVPPGVDVFSTVASDMLANGTVTSATMMWHTPYQDRFLEVMDDHGGAVRAVFAGHTHMDEFRLVHDAARSASGRPVLVVPAVSPLFGNYPGLKVFAVDAGSWLPADYTARAMDLAAASPAFNATYAFADTYRVGAPTPARMDRLFARLETNATAKAAYTANYDSQAPSGAAINATTWPIYRCAAGYVRKAAFMACVNGT